MDRISAMEVFVRVVQSGSFSAAARDLDLTPSAVSKQIGRLEDRLGARLMNRTTRQLSLTEVGAGFFERASRILTDVVEAERAVVDLHGAPRGTLKLNIPQSFGRRYVVPIIPDFVANFPEIHIDLTLNDRFVDLVEEGIDLAIRIGELSDSSLIARRLAPNRRIVCGTPAYFARHGRPASPADLVEHNCMVYTYRASRNDWRFITPEGGEEVVTVAGNLEANEAEALYSFMLADVGLCLLPLWLVGPDLESGRLEQACQGYHGPDSAISAVYPPGRHLSPKVRAFVDFLVERFAGWGRSFDGSGANGAA